MASLQTISGYDDARAYLAGGRDKHDRPLGHNTRLHERWDGAIAVRYHATDVITFWADGGIVIRTNGWETVTTATRINHYLPGPWRVGSVKGSWWLWHGRHPMLPFADGLTVYGDERIELDGTVLMNGDDIRAEHERQTELDVIRADKRRSMLTRQHQRGAESGRTVSVYTGHTGDHSDGTWRAIYENRPQYHPRSYDGTMRDCPTCREDRES